MAKQFDSFTKEHTDFVAAQHIVFIGTAAADGRVNVSPKGMDSLKVLSPNRLIWRNLSGSGNETAGHLKLVNRMTVMWCSFTSQPLIMRAYGSAKTISPKDDAWETLNGHFPANPGARQVYDMTVDMVQTSCGWGVPFLDYQRDRNVLAKWAEAKGDDGIRETWARDNQATIDGFPTGILE